jgi:hypothetical protein
MRIYELLLARPTSRFVSELTSLLLPQLLFLGAANNASA